MTLKTVGNPRIPPDLLGAGYLEMLARQMTEDLRQIRDALPPGSSRPLVTKGVSFGTLTHRLNGSWDSSAVSGLPTQSLVSSAATSPSLIVRPWRLSGSIVSLREMTTSSYNQHLGIQATERFGVGTDPDGDGVVNEITRGDVTAVVLFEATLPVPGRVIPADANLQRAIAEGEQQFKGIGCSTCHVPALPLVRKGWIYSEPGRSGHAITVDLSGAALPQPRLTFGGDSVALDVPAYTDLKLHDITDPSDASAQEPLDLNQPQSSARFHAGNRLFLTRRLWSIGNQPPYWHDGRFTTIREAIMAHAGEAREARTAFERLSKPGQDGVIEFLKSLQALPRGTKVRVVDEHFQPTDWPLPVMH